MVFSSLFFAFFFLVLCYGCYYFAKTIKTKNIILLVSSLIFYAWGGPALVLLICMMTFICWGGALLISQTHDSKTRKAFCAITVTICIAVLFVYKYAGFTLTTVYSIFNINSAIPAITLPIGISFYTFQLISYVADVCRGDVEAQRSYWLLLLYASLFHQCIAGPIVRYADVNNDIESRVLNREEISAGITRFSIGLAKKAILANGCGIIFDKIFCDSQGVALTASGISELSSAGILLGCFCYMLQIYLDFSAYSDMAIGMGLMVGFHYKENFNYPYIADSVTDFWRRWHMSLSSFFRDYVYIPLGGNRVSVPRHIFNMFAVWALTGIWHGANWNFIIWGLFFFVFLIIEKYIIKPKDNPSIFIKIPRIIITLVIVFVSFMIFKFTDLPSLWEAIMGIFNSNGKGFSDIQTSMLFKNNIFFIVACCVACTPVIPALSKLAKRNRFTEKIWTVCGIIMPIILVILSSFALAGDSYNPFMYFQF